MKRVLRGDAVWDALLGVACLVVAFFAGGWWPVLAALGVGCLVFAAFLERAARGKDSLVVCRAAMAGNAIAVPAVIVVLVLLPEPAAATVAALIVVAVVCDAFAVLEWRAARAH